MNVKGRHLAALAAIAVLAVFVLRTRHHDPCAVHWRVGTIDPRFEISQYDVVNAASAAANDWNTAAGRRVLFYDTQRGIPLNLVYDERHAAIAADRARREEIRRLGNTINSLQAQFAANPTPELADHANILIRRYNHLVDAYNAQAPGEFKAGSYQEHLEVYAFADLVDLQFVIMHEFGHALGLEHVPDSGAVMNARHLIGSAAAVKLSDADLQALKTQCARK